MEVEEPVYSARLHFCSRCWNLFILSPEESDCVLQNPLAEVSRNHGAHLTPGNAHGKHTHVEVKYVLVQRLRRRPAGLYSRQIDREIEKDTDWIIAGVCPAV